MAISIRAAIVSVYGAVLEKAEPLSDAEERWQALCKAQLGGPAPMSLAEFNAAVIAVAARSDESAKAAGIPHPIAYWPSAALEALPALATLSPDVRGDFLYTHAQLRMPTRVVPGAVIALRKMHKAGIVLGLASNGDPHTPIELALAFDGSRGLASALLPVGLQPEQSEQAENASGGLSIFTRPLCFWGFAHGFGKPDPHVFRHLSRRLAVRGIAPEETAMFGNSEDSDLAPARTFGWKAWRLADESDGGESGNWFGATGWMGIE